MDNPFFRLSLSSGSGMIDRGEQRWQQHGMIVVLLEGGSLFRQSR